MSRRTSIAASTSALAAMAIAVAQPPAADGAVAAAGRAGKAGQTIEQPAPAIATPQQIRTIVPAAVDAAGLSSRLVMWWQEGSTWHVALSRTSTAAIAALKTKLGRDTVVISHAPVYASVKTTKMARNARVVHVKVKKRSRSIRSVRPMVAVPPPPGQGGTWVFSNRYLDGVPYSGGDRIFRQYTFANGDRITFQCTSATLTNLGMLSAGHCDGGTPNTVWQQGYLASNRTIYTTGTYGTAIKSVWTNNRIDASVLRPYVGGFNKTMYLDTQYTVPSKFAYDNGIGTVRVGVKVCTNGSFSDLKCGGTVVRTNLCLNVTGDTISGVKKTVRQCGLAEATAASPIVQSGDSGGAVLASTNFNSSGQNAVTYGIISAQGGTTNPSKDLFFSDIKSVNATLRTTVVNNR